MPLEGGKCSRPHLFIYFVLFWPAPGFGCLLSWRNNELAGAPLRAGQGWAPRQRAVPLSCPASTCNPPGAGSGARGPPGAAATACGERCRWQQQPARVAWPQLNLLQTASITVLFLIFLAGLGK